MDVEYRYSATQNNGTITQMKDWISGEEVNYLYDSLQRLSSATTTGPEWGLNFAYDGFGNRTSQSVTKGAAPTAIFSYDLNNHLVGYGYGYDANGNIISMRGQTDLAYDASNRLVSASGENYAYTADNKRVYKRTANGDEYFYFYLGNRQLGTYTLGTNGFTLAQQSTFFMGRRIGTVAKVDRLGSEISGSKYFPFGEQAVNSTQAAQFATYTLDATGLDYADQRYYSRGLGRFLSSDPYQASGGPSDPGSWNRYAYVSNDPVNLIDPSGLNEESPTYYTSIEVYGGPNHLLDVLRSLYGGGGGGGGSRVYDEDRGDGRAQATRDLKRDRLDRVISAKAKEALANKDCNKLFMTGNALDPSDVLDKLLHGDTYGSIQIGQLDTGTEAQTTASLLDLRISFDPPGTYYTQVSITLNSEYFGTSQTGDVITLLHELWHAMNLLSVGHNQFQQNDASNDMMNQANTKLVEDNCVKSLKF